MAGKYQLSKGSLKTILRGGNVDDPVMQVLGSKKINSGSADKERHRILLSDGQYLFSFAMFTTSISNENIITGDMEQYSIIKIKKYITSVINNTGKAEKRILVILDVEMLATGSTVGEKIGNPINLPEDGSEAPEGNGEEKRQPPMKKPKLMPDLNGSVNNTSILEDQLLHPISSLSPYHQKWVIKARVTNKSQMRTWSNSRGEGKLFNFDLLDESGEIRATAFKECADKFFPMIEIDKVYFISKGRLKPANKQFSTLKNDYELTLDTEAIVQECLDETDTVPTTQFNFTEINKIAQMEIGSVVDIIGVVKQASDVTSITSKKTGRELRKRELSVVDPSKTCIGLTLWGQDAESYDLISPVIAIKGAKIGEFGGGKNLSCMGGTIVKYNPDISEAFAMRGWYDNGGDQEQATNISAMSEAGSFAANWMKFADTKKPNFGNNPKGDYYQVKGTILLMKAENSTYKACPQPDCQKKVIDQENGHYRCEKCNQEFPTFKYRIIGNIHVGDWSGSKWISMFTSEAEKLLDMTADEYGKIGEASAEEQLSVVDRINFREFILKCRSKVETYNDEQRVKTVAIRINNINYKQYNAHLIENIQQYMA